MSTKVLVLGASGQLGRALAESCPREVEWLVPPGGRVDLREPAALQAAVQSLRPSVVINTAAYTAVDRAESEPEIAHAVNAEAPRQLAFACHALDARLVQVSTDFVFDGTGGRPYLPEDRPAPLGVYGRTKAAGERGVLETLGSQGLVLRTAWVYQPGGGNFVKTMLRLLQSRAEVRVVADQVGTPTAASGLAGAIWTLMTAEAQGIHHWTDAGVASWYDLAVAVRDIAAQLAPERPWAQVLPIRSEDYPTPCQRPAYSVLDKTRTWAITGVPPHWRHRLEQVLRSAGVDTF